MKLGDKTAWLNQVVEILPAADREFEWYVNSGMRGRITAIRPRDEYFEVRLDLREFMAYNEPHLEYNFYDRNGVPRLNVFEARMINSDNPVEELYIGEDNWDRWLKIVDDVR